MTREEIKQFREEMHILREVFENCARDEVGAVVDGCRGQANDLLPELPINDIPSFEKWNVDL